MYQPGMNCKHRKWILDRNNLGVCVECGTTKQFPVEPIPKINFGELPKYDPDSWLNAEVHGLEERI